MPYVESDGTYVNTEAFPPVVSAARTATGSSAAVETGQWDVLRGLLLDVTAVSGTTPTLTVTVETSADSSTWYTVASFVQRTAAGTERKSFPGLDRWARLTWTVGGTTPSFTFAITSGELV